MTCLIILTIVCAFANAYQISQYKTDTRNIDIDSVLNQLKSAFHISSQHDDTPREHFSVFDINRPAVDDDIKIKQPLYSSINSLQQLPLVKALLEGGYNSKGIEVNKRQGSWDYDYGLGGGRFGKRSEMFGKRAGMFADYSLGEGRFGRDLDHVT